MLEGLTAEIRASFGKDIEDDKEEDEDEPTLPPELRDQQKLKEKAKRALDTYKSMKCEGTRKKLPKKISITDPECRYLPSGGRAVRSYNLQAAVDAKTRIVVAAHATNCTDNAELGPMVKEIEQNTGNVLPKEITADKGYCERAPLRDLKEKGVVAYVPQKERTNRKFSLKDFVYEESTDTYRCPAGKTLHAAGECKDGRNYSPATCEGCAHRLQCLTHKGARTRHLTLSEYQKEIEEMVARTASPLGKEKAITRASTVETLFGHLKHNRDLRQLYFRGKAMIDSFWKLEVTAVNIEKIAAFRMAAMTGIS
jgi:hypothetical protein